MATDPNDGVGAPAATRSYLMDEARFHVPAGWEDRSVHILAAVSADGGDGPPEFTLTVHRDTPRDGEDLGAYVRRQLGRLHQAIPDLDVLRQGARVVGGVPGWEVEIRWTGEQGRLRQHQVHMLRGGRVLTWTATAPATRYLRYADQFAEAIESVRFVARSFVVRPAEGSAEG